mgnify:CR=1 FL=1|tara:strand:+ start:20632 stop:21027 length:396 start_codon:yes stop_codon:yes gene_type:complete
MQGIGPELPLNRDHRFGNYSLVTSYKEEVKQNFKNLLLTSPGERMMIPDFGVGLRNFLFNPRPHATAEIRQRITSQTSKYMPYIQINKIIFDQGKPEEDLTQSHMLSIIIDYEVTSINLEASIILNSEDIN